MYKKILACRKKGKSLIKVKNNKFDATLSGACYSQSLSRWLPKPGQYSLCIYQQALYCNAFFPCLLLLLLTQADYRSPVVKLFSVSVPKQKDAEGISMWLI